MGRRERGGEGRRPLFSYANVAATLALVLAVSGGAYAAGLKKNSVGPKQIKPNAVITAKIAAAAVTGDKLAPGAVGASALADGAVTNAKLAPGAVTASQVADGSLGPGKFSSSIPAVQVTRSLDQSIPNSSGTDISFDVERYDTAGMHDGVNPTRLTAPITGLYLLAANVAWASNTTGQRLLIIQKNNSGTGEMAVDTSNAVVGGGQTFQSASQVVRLVAGDYVELSMFQDSGGALNVSENAESSPTFTMTWLAPGP